MLFQDFDVQIVALFCKHLEFVAVQKCVNLVDPENATKLVFTCRSRRRYSRERALQSLSTHPPDFGMRKTYAKALLVRSQGNAMMVRFAFGGRRLSVATSVAPALAAADSECDFPR